MKTQHTPIKIAFRRPWPGTLRGLILWQFGLAFILVGGLNYIGTTIPEPTRTYLAFVLDFRPGWYWGCMFIAAGLFAMVSAYCHFDRDRWGYLLTSVLSATWGMVYVCGWAFYDAPVRALGGSIIWLLYASILTTCARIPKITLSFGKEL
jgi:hypothetical protein